MIAAALLVPFAAPAGAVLRTRSTPTYAADYQAYGPTDLVGVTCPTSQVCLAVGEQPQYSMLYRSTDGGATWTPMADPGGSLNSSYVDQDQSVAISCGDPSFCVLEFVTTLADASVDEFDVSRDGGLTWAVAGSVEILDERGTGLADLTCVGVGTCLGLLGGKVVSTTDGATSWATHDGSSGTVGLACLSARRCYVLQTTAKRNTDVLVVSSTTNRGGTLVPLLRATSTGWNANPVISCASTLACSVITSGSEPEVDATTDGGRSWRSQSAPLWPMQQRVRALQCTTAQDCTVLATDLTSLSKIVSFSTADGGSSWLSTSVGQLGFPGAIPSLWCGATTTRCLAALGTRSVFDIDDVDLGSSTWSPIAVSISAPPLHVVACQKDGECLALGGGIKATSTDDGHTWTVGADPALDDDVITSLTCPLASTCVASGYSVTGSATSGLVLLTTDLGSDWTSATLPWEVGNVNDVQCATAGTCLALPGFSSALSHVPTFVLRSTDGGLDWSLVELASASADVTLSAVQCPTASHCIAVGGASTAAVVDVSDDAGATWSTVDASSGGFGGDTAFEGLGCTSALDCETSATTQGSSDVYAYGTTDGGSTWSQLGLMLPHENAGYWGATPSLASCSNGNCVGYSVNVVGPERPYYYVSLLASADGGATWDAYVPPYLPAEVGVALAPDGTVIAVGENAEAGPLLEVGTA